MLDLDPIKARLDGVSRELSLGDAEFIGILALQTGDAAFLADAVYDVAVLVEEVERLQEAIRRHRAGWQRCENLMWVDRVIMRSKQARELWGSLE